VGPVGVYFQCLGDLKFYRFYGILASPVAFMLWLYSGAAAFILGAQVNASIQEQSAPGRDSALGGTVQTKLLPVMRAGE
jgi:uncharacterized BrkB/YihY/UPF0761 family membrane protein